jgi:hypothetical protein
MHVTARHHTYYRGTGKQRAQEAAAAAISSPLLDFPIERARGVVFNIVGGEDLTLQEVRACVREVATEIDVLVEIYVCMYVCMYAFFDLIFKSLCLRILCVSFGIWCCCMVCAKCDDVLGVV